MVTQYSTACRNAANNTIEATIGTAPILEIRTGSAPAACATADSGTLLASITLPSDWLGASSSGAAAKAGTWTGTASVGGVPGHYRIKDSTGTTCHMQDVIVVFPTAIPATGGMQVSHSPLVALQNFTVSTFNQTTGGA